MLKILFILDAWIACIWPPYRYVGAVCDAALRGLITSNRLLEQNFSARVFYWQGALETQIDLGPCAIPERYTGDHLFLQQQDCPQ